MVRDSWLKPRAAQQEWKDTDVSGTELPSTLGGVSVTINGLPASLLSVSPSAIYGIAEYDRATGPVEVIVTRDGESAPARADLARFSPSLFSLSVSGQRYVSALQEDGTVASKPSALERRVDARSAIARRNWFPPDRNFASVGDREKHPLETRIALNKFARGRGGIGGSETCSEEQHARTAL